MSSAAASSLFTALLARLRRVSPSAATSKPERRWARWLAYVSFFVVSFVWFVYLTFPYDRVRDFLVHQVERAMPGAELEIVSLEPAWLTGVEARGVRLRLAADPEPPRPASSESSGTGEARRPPRPSVTIPRLYARASILSFLAGTKEVVFEIEVDGGGSIEGVVADDGRSSRLRAHLEGVDLRRIGVLRRYLGVSLGGVVGGDIELTVADRQDDTDGSVSLSIAEATVGDERFEVPLPVPGLSALQLTRAALGEVGLEITVENGIGRVTRLSANGDDVIVRGNGTLRLHRSLRMTSLDVVLRAAIQPSYLQRNPAVAAALELAGSSPLVAPYRAPDGAFQIRLQGTLGARITALPAGSITIDE